MPSKYKENMIYALRTLWEEIIYSIFTIIYLMFLNNFNNILLSKFDNADYLIILFYNKYETILYFVIAILFFLTGTILIMHRWKKIKYEELEFEDIILNFVAIIILLILMVLIFVFINNPILRAVLIGLFLLYVAGSN